MARKPKPNIKTSEKLTRARKLYEEGASKSDVVQFLMDQYDLNRSQAYQIAKDGHPEEISKFEVAEIDPVIAVDEERLPHTDEELAEWVRFRHLRPESKALTIMDLERKSREPGIAGMRAFETLQGIISKYDIGGRKVERIKYLIYDPDTDTEKEAGE